MDVRRDCVNYVQDERYAAGAGSAGAACISFAQHFSICMGAKGVQCLVSGHAVNPSMGARSRLLSRTVLKQDTTPPRLRG